MIVRALTNLVQKLTNHLTTELGFEPQDPQTISFEKFQSSMDELEEVKKREVGETAVGEKIAALEGEVALPSVDWDAAEGKYCGTQKKN
jgi:hypothetical protein